MQIKKSNAEVMAMTHTGDCEMGRLKPTQLSELTNQLEQKMDGDD